MNVDDIINDIINTEGGYIDHPADKGGPTKYGITQKTLSAWLGRNATADDVKRISRSLAYVIYQRNYYFKPNIDSLPGPIQAQVLDIAVNSGPIMAVKMLQRVLVNLGHPVGAIDGAIGQKTCQAAASALAKNPAALHNALVERRKRFYRAIIRRDPSQKVFENGWLARAEKFRQKTILA